MRKSALEGEVTRGKELNNQLLAKIKEMQQSKDVMMQKLERLESMPPTPSSTPTHPSISSGTSEQDHLEQEMRRLRDEVDSLRAERDKANRDKLAVDEMFQGSNRKSQNLTEEVFNLQGEVSQLKQQLEEEQRKVQEMEGHRHEFEMHRGVQEEAAQSVQQLRQECDGLRAEVSRVDREKGELDRRVTSLLRERDYNLEEVKRLQESRDEVRKAKRQLEVTKADMEEKLMFGGSGDHAEALTSMKKHSTMPKRLNDAMGKIKQLEAVSAPCMGWAWPDMTHACHLHGTCMLFACDGHGPT